jgi:N-carbamoylputrescine amidase
MGRSLRVALAQVSTGPEREENVNRALRMMADAAQAGAQLIVFPEMSVDPFFPQVRADKSFVDWGVPVPGPLSDRFQEQAAALGLATVVNLFERAGPGKYYDCSPVFDCQGSYLGKQRMSHILEGPGYNERYYYWEAELETQFHAVWEMEMQAAAVANGVFIAVANRVGVDGGLTFFGHSFAVNPYGEVLVRAPEEGVALLLVDLELELIEQARRDMPFLRDRRPEIYGSLVKR